MCLSDAQSHSSEADVPEADQESVSVALFCSKQHGSCNDGDDACINCDDTVVGV